MIEPDKATLRAVAADARAALNAKISELASASSAADYYIKTLASAVDRLREIAALKGTSKRQRVNSELAISWLLAHGYALEEGGYVPGKGFENTQQESKS